MTVNRNHEIMAERNWRALKNQQKRIIIKSDYRLHGVYQKADRFTVNASDGKLGKSSVQSHSNKFWF